MSDLENDDYDSDSWFYESFKRYRTLQMFELEHTPQHIIQSCDTKILVASKHERRNKNELLQMEIPLKLIKPSCEEGLCKINDFKIVSGGFANHFVHQMDILEKSGRLITSEYGGKGLFLYDVNENDKELIQHCDSLQSNMETPNFSKSSDEHLLFITKSASDPLLIFDSNTLNNTRTDHLDFSNKNSDSVVTSVNLENRPIILNKYSGEIMYADVKSKNVNLFNKDHEDKGEWNISTPNTENCVSALSLQGSFLSFDIRMLSEAVNKGNIEPLGNNFKFKFHPLNSSVISISGFDEYVYVYSCSKEASLSFKHDGHLRTEDYSLRPSQINTVVNHLCVPNIGLNFIISFSGNKSLNCWDPNLS